ncbi:hypothetical protein BCR37DRAFT_369870 [Protomyces lactucae-debilis]|uniref:Myb-like domain-containing protein n=1 Tax=Protomyces lactucae-debilis TaxID=2754530 RepID=A0A1Y2F7X9_PROLT|nr:uncharacterized protein BCR37DRAFT_369870 [Protomyces lactucae-debilis]ORY80020.1 hypothetical protein BCR37DRAFT_369870 [Protomyces lactucae-debilis]
MADLCKGSGRGQKSSKFAKFEEIIAERKRDKKLGRKEQAPAPRELPVHNDPGSVIKTRVVNGEIVLDPESLTVDRSQRLADLDGPREVVDVDDMKRRVNSASHGKPIGKVRWDDTATEQFYTALSQWGTDFEMIAQMFPSRDRKQIKSKFTLEERRNPHLITRALIRKKPVDMEVYAKQSAKTFRPIEELEAELQQLRDRYEEERQASMKEAEQRKQEMQSQAQAMPALPEKRKSRRLRAGDDGVELLGTIEEVEDAAKLQARHEDDDDEDD